MSIESVVRPIGCKCELLICTQAPALTVRYCSSVSTIEKWIFRLMYRFMPKGELYAPVSYDKKQKSIARRAGIAGALGSLVEYYDFSLFGLLAVEFSPLFFPARNAAVSTLVALSAFGVSYLARPVGGAVLGLLGDRYGRRPVLMATIVVMGLASGCIGLLPTYSQIGVAAPVLLVVLRLVQGFSAGGELAGATTYAVESAPAGRRTFYGAIVSSGGSIGFIIAAIAAAVVNFLVAPAQLSAWGWRIPFLLALPLAITCLAFRMKIDESPEFSNTATSHGSGRNAIVDVVRKYPIALLKVIGIAIAAGGSSYIGLVYLSVYLVGTRHFSPTVIYWISSLAISVEVVTLPGFGMLSFIVGRRRLLLYSTALMAVLAYPFFAVLSTIDNLVIVAVIYCAYMVVDSAQKAPLVTEFALMFPSQYRYTGTAMGHNVGAALAGGFSPYIAAQLVLLTGSPTAPAYWLIGVSAIGVAVLMTMRPFFGSQ
ncbi:MFS transporter [Nocardia jiangxiensis]|uniref:MFS transporter n=1 Tax=Nocardia jiangxiensis TaxID=282685 RepID=UPI0002F997EA|nr:MFS transporter [Nocardia jiangxiensis]